MEGPRPATPDDFDQVMALVNSVFLPDAEPTMQQDYPLVFNPDDTENLRIILDDGKPVSNISLKQWPICICGCVTRIGSIGSVCTHPDHRGEGHASKILKHCTDDLDFSGGCLMLISGSRGLYRRAHATSVGRMLNCTVGADEATGTSGGGFEVAPCDLAHIPDYAKLYEQEAVRFIRQPHHWQKMLHVALKAEGRKTREFVEIRQGGELVAYAVLMLPTRPYHKELARMVEYAGSREAVVSSLADIMGRNDLDRVALRIPDYDAAMKVQAMRFGHDLTVSAMPGTWKMINLPRFTGDIWGYLEERVGEETARELYFSDEEDQITLRFRDDRFIARDGTQLMQILFGSAEEAVPMDDVPADLRKILEAIAPIPLPLAGMNAV